MQVTVYHAPKRPELQLQGLEGTVKSIVKVFKGKELSANLPYRVEFHLEAEGGKQQKLLVHLVSSPWHSTSNKVVLPPWSVRRWVLLCRTHQNLNLLAEHVCTGERRAGLCWLKHNASPQEIKDAL